MKTWTISGRVVALLLFGSPAEAQYAPAQNVIGGGLAGAGVGAALGAIAGGGRGAATGALIGGTVGAVGVRSARRPRLTATVRPIGERLIAGVAPAGIGCPITTTAGASGGPDS